jgi:hypothetical protein
VFEDDAIWIRALFEGVLQVGNRPIELASLPILA